MKKNYISPVSEVIRIKLKNSILDDIPVVIGSRGARPEDSFAKENNFDDFYSEEDIWSGHQTKDVWER